ncbi:RdgB/HAM1 family non-canonical purine NTP pyrophosphatase [Hymenobacter defluvii]|uniref:dITP/XTP pyrophosphatase n=1 Tax=Hymenobacter defluvii TaxID=2054411 RepID=A0ABS3TGH9_9BACT|nr:RdgB/HAM1 family non-canonical purine NTP pyrophosphatase [Hymenobacter defluvii]MBO3272733.1 RdgB/HAM1 family non-canonical purine NTP pyrophosphatase [Hymenobacter defluvii]
MRLCFASNNAHKLDEIRAILPSSIELVSLADIGGPDDLPETQDTLVGNAHQKAQYVWDHFGVACFADDTGLEIDALNGAPGVYSARYAGPQRLAADNVAKVLDELADAPSRTAQFRTVIALILSDSEKHTFNGVVEGLITTEPRGDAGFGYDPIFQPVGFQETFAEMPLAQKNTLSHRARAVQQLVAFFESREK